MFFQSVLIALAAGALLVENTILIGNNPDLALTCSVMVLTFCAYRIAPWLSAVSKGKPLLFQFKPFVAVVVCLFILVALFFPLRNPSPISIFLIAAGFFWFYQMGLTNHHKPLRNNKWAKPTIIAVVWTLCCSVSLCVSSDSLDFSACHMTTLSCFFFILPMALLCDVADMEVDGASGVRNLAVCFGPKTIAMAAALVGAVPALFYFLSISNIEQKWTISLIATAGFCLAAAILVLLLSPRNSRVWVDVLMLMKPFIIILVSI